jgi:hypothetical protein
MAGLWKITTKLVGLWAETGVWDFPNMKEKY